MKAEELLAKYGISLVGKKVMTYPYGDYPGGEAKVVEVEPYSNDPKVVFNVRHPTFGEIWIFDDEDVEEL